MARQLSKWLFASLLTFAHVPAWASCESSLAKVKIVATSVSVTINPDGSPRAGVGIRIVWSKSSRARPDIPTCIVITAPEQVRFAGTGFMALAANAGGPNRMQFAKAQSRALIALYRDNDKATQGELTITPYRVGAQTLAWTVVTAGSCGELVLARGERALDVQAGTAKLVVQNRFATENPTLRIRSRTGTHEIFVFGGRFEVRDVATGSVLISTADTDPNFSPAGRFVAWRQSDDFYSVADLASGAIVATDIMAGALVWAKEDSYLIAAGSAWSAFRIKNMLVDDSNVLAAQTGCHACDAWSSAQAVLDIDRGFALVKGIEGWKIADLFATPSSDADQGEVQTTDALTEIRRAYDSAYPAVPTVWNVGERLALSHGESRSSNYRTQAKFIVQYGRDKVNSAVATSAGSEELVGRAVAPGKIADIEAIKSKAQADPVFYSLGRFGIKTLAPAAAEHFSVPQGADANPAGNLTARIDEIRNKLPAARSVLVAKVEFGDQNKCNLASEPNRPFKVDATEVSDIWHWRAPGGDRWLVVSEYSEGSGAFFQGCLLLLREGSAQPIILVNPELLGIETAGGQTLDLRAYRVDNSLIAVAAHITDRINGIRLLDIEAAKTVGPLIPLVEGPMLSELRLTKDGGHLVQLNKDGRFFVYRLADGKAVLQGAYVDNEIVVMTDDGRYDTSYEGAESVQLRFAGMPGLFTVSQFATMLWRPSLAGDVLQGRAIAARPDISLSPPSVQLTLAASVASPGGQRTGKVVANSSKGLATVHLHVDGRLVNVIPVQGQHAEIPISLPDPGGARWVSAIAIDERGLVSLPSTIHLPGPPRAHGVARLIAVGVDAYTDPEFPPLHSTKLDAQHFVRAIETTRGRAFTAIHPQLLMDKDVTRESVLNAVQAAANETEEDDTLIFFFAGHGVDGTVVDQPGAGLVLATNRTRVADLANTSVPWTVLADLLSSSKGDRDRGA